jgi:deoxyhypusine monooxygenase
MVTFRVCTASCGCRGFVDRKSNVRLPRARDLRYTVCTVRPLDPTIPRARKGFRFFHMRKRDTPPSAHHSGCASTFWPSVKPHCTIIHLILPTMSPAATADLQPASDNATQVDPTVLALRKTLTSETTPLAKRFRALFSLKHLASLDPPTAQTIPAIEAIAAALSSPSALLKHELAYCLGQSGKEAAIPYLQAVIRDRGEDAMCRHEAAEALGALGDQGSLPLLQERRDDAAEEEVVRETCEIAVERIEWVHSEQRKAEKLRQSDFASVDPAPPMPQEEQEKKVEIDELEHTLLDTSLPLFKRYRAMFALRDLASPPDLPTAVPAIQALAKGFNDPSALFRHEIAFVFGQLSHPASIPSLVEALSDVKEASMVRHEAAEALGSLGEEEGVEEVLRKFLDDPEQVVRDSVVVALDMAEFEKNGEREYAEIPVVEATA